MTEKASPVLVGPPWYATTNLILNGTLIAQGERLPANVPEHLLTYWLACEAIRPMPVTETADEVKSETELLQPHGTQPEPHSEKKPAHPRR